VLAAFGNKFWKTHLFKLYQSLIWNDSKIVRIILSENLHTIAKLIGEQRTEIYLLRPFKLFITCRDYKIKIGVIKHVVDFYSVISKHKP
jgi:hypothetical protein